MHQPEIISSLKLSSLKFYLGKKLQMVQSNLSIRWNAPFRRPPPISPFPFILVQIPRGAGLAPLLTCQTKLRIVAIAPSSALPSSSFNAASRRRRTHSAASSRPATKATASSTRSNFDNPRAWVSE
jgi:hypothetical protein